MRMVLGIKLDIGELNEMRSTKLKEVLEESFSEVGMVNNSLVFQQEQIVANISPDKILYSITDISDIGDMIRNTNAIIDTLMIDCNLERKINIKFNDIIDCDNAMDMSKQFLKNFNEEQFIGAGVRLFFKYEGEVCEIKQEPYLSDPTKIFIESYYNMENGVKWILENIHNVWEDFELKKTLLYFDK